MLIVYVGLVVTGLSISPVPPLKPALSDFRKDAATLFDNLRVPAAIVNTAAIGSAFSLRPLSSDLPVIAVVKRCHTLLAVSSIGSELLAIVTATVAINKLSEVESAPTTSVVELLLSEDYEFSWISVNVQFFAGLFGLASMVLLHACVWGAAHSPTIGRVSAYIMVSSVCLMASVINEGTSRPGVVASGPNQNLPFGRTLSWRYVQLLSKRARRAPLVLLGLFFALLATTTGMSYALRGCLVRA